MPSIVIPAHDEARSIGRLLDALAPLAHEVEVVVVCNGCTDATADIARARGGWVTVLELAEGSKPRALDAGDATATTFPRCYLDADVAIGAADVRRLLASVGSGALQAAGPTPRYDLSGCSRVVRSHHRFWERLPANRRGIAGTNAMAVTEEGRRRFERWPELIGDDYFLDGLFADAEKARVPDATVLRPTPHRFADCVSRKARVHQGNVDIRAAGHRQGHDGGGVGGARVVLREDPRLLVDLPAHAAVTVSTRVVSWWRRRNGTAQTWFRDSSREEPAAA